MVEHVARIEVLAVARWEFRNGGNRSGMILTGVRMCDGRSVSNREGMEFQMTADEQEKAR